MRIRKDMDSGLADMGNRNPVNWDERVLNRLCGRRSDYMMRALAQRTIAMGCTVHVDVHDFDCGAEKQKDRDEPHEQIANSRALKTSSTDPSHI